MRIEVDLMAIHDAPHLGRVAAVALLSALPHDEAVLAVVEWQAVCEARERDALDAAAVKADEHHEVAPAVEEQALDGAKPLPAMSGTAVHSDGSREYVHAGTRLEDALSVKAANALKHAGFQVLGDLEGRSGEWLLGTVDRFGKAALAEVEAAMAAAGLALAREGGVPSAPRRTGTISAAEVAAAKDGELVEDRAGPPTPRADAPEHDDIPFGDEPMVVHEEVLGPEKQSSLLDNGGGEGEPEPLRDLCRRAADHVGREAVAGILRRHGVGKLSLATPEQEAAVRASVAEALHAP